MSNQAAFLTTLRAELVARYAWAQDKAKLDHTIARTAETMDTVLNHVLIDGPAYVAAWRAIGMKGKPTYKALRALPKDPFAHQNVA